MGYKWPHRMRVNSGEALGRAISDAATVQFCRDERRRESRLKLEGAHKYSEPTSPLGNDAFGLTGSTFRMERTRRHPGAGARHTGEDI